MAFKKTEPVYPFEIHHSKDYSRLNVEAQRIFPNQISPPYLTWHFSTWPDVGEHPNDAKSQVMRNDRRAEWHQKNDEFITRLTGRKSAPYVADAALGLLRNTLGGNVLTFEGLPFNSAVFLRVEFHEEHISYTFTLPVRDAAHLPADGNADYVAGSSAITGVAHDVTDPNVDALVESIWCEIELQEGEEPKCFRDRTAKAWDRLYGEAWKIAFKNAPPELVVSAAQNRNNLGGGPPGCVFCNFRGVVLPRDWLVKAYGKNEVNLHLERKKTGQEQFVPTDIAHLPSVLEIDQLEKRMKFVDNLLMGERPPQTPRRWNRVSAGRVLERNRGLRHALHWLKGEVPEALLDEPHFHRRTVANLVVDGRALYASSFAAALDRNFGKGRSAFDADPSSTAVRFCVFYCAEIDENGAIDERAQSLLSRRLDRLLLRLHSLGTLRLIALKDLPGMMKIDARLNDIEREIVDGALGRDPERISIGDIRRLNGELSALSEHTTGSVYFRASKSALYSEQFMRLVDDLNHTNEIARIEGWEPYIEFVRRRLYAQFDNIIRIGDRVEYVRQRLDRQREQVMLKKAEQDSKIMLSLTFSVVILTIIVSFDAVRELFDIFH